MKKCCTTENSVEPISRIYDNWIDEVDNLCKEFTVIRFAVAMVLALITTTFNIIRVYGDK